MAYFDLLLNPSTQRANWQKVGMRAEVGENQKPKVAVKESPGRCTHILSVDKTDESQQLMWGAGDRD